MLCFLLVTPLWLYHFIASAPGPPQQYFRSRMYDCANYHFESIYSVNVADKSNPAPILRCSGPGPHSCTCDHYERSCTGARSCAATPSTQMSVKLCIFLFWLWWWPAASDASSRQQPMGSSQWEARGNALRCADLARTFQIHLYVYVYI